MIEQPSRAPRKLVLPAQPGVPLTDEPELPSDLVRHDLEPENNPELQAAMDAADRSTGTVRQVDQELDVVPFEAQLSGPPSSKQRWTASGSRVPTPTNRLLPQSPDAERALLASFLLAPQIVGGICQKRGITPRHFFIPSHEEIYTALMYLNDRRMLNGDGADFIVLTQYLHDSNRLAECGGPAFITELYTFLPTAANAAYYIEILWEKFALRENIVFHTEQLQRSYEAQPEVWDLLEDGKQKAAALAEAHGKPRTRLPAICDLSLMLGAAMPPCPLELVHGLLHQGSKMVIGGTSKSMKTFSLIDLATAVATGTEWWGSQCVKGRVCYINFEIQEAFFCRRVDAICRVKGVELQAGMLMGWTLRGHAEGIENLVDEVLAALGEDKFALIIVDPIYKALGNRDENKAGDVASLCNELERIAVKTGAAVVFGAHFSKGNQAAKESIDRIGGSGVFARDPDSILTMTAHAEPDCFTVQPVLRNFAPAAPFVIRWSYPLFVVDEALDPDELKSANSPKTPQVAKTPIDLKALVPMQGAIPKNALISHAQTAGIGAKRAIGFVEELVASGELFIWKRSRPGTNPEISISRHERRLL